jgi:tight adherence protein C
MPESLSELLGGDWLYLAVLGMTSVGAVLLVVSARYLMGAPRVDPVQERLQRAITGRAAGAIHPPAGREGHRKGSPLASIARVATPTDARELGRLRAKLSHAGLRTERALVNYLASKVLLGLLLAGLFLWFNAVRPLETLYALFFTIASMTAGFYLPTLRLMSQIQTRQKEINQAIPNALDLLVTCVEAGLGLEAAINRVAEEIRLFSPLLADELTQTSLEMQAGATRAEAFRRLAERTGVEELQSLSAVIVQTQIFGTSIAESLRIQAESMRVRRMNVAEERAAEAGVKMSIPLVLCITPSLFSVLLGPAVVQIYRNLLPVFLGE